MDFSFLFGRKNQKKEIIYRGEGRMPPKEKMDEAFEKAIKYASEKPTFLAIYNTKENFVVYETWEQIKKHPEIKEMQRNGKLIIGDIKKIKDEKLEKAIIELIERGASEVIVILIDNYDLADDKEKFENEKIKIEIITY